MYDDPDAPRGPAETSPRRGEYSYPAGGAGGSNPPALPPGPELPRAGGTRRSAVLIGVVLLAAGGWLMLAPLALGYSTVVATVNDLVAGFLLVVVAFAALVTRTHTPWPSLVAVLLGVWVTAAPFVLFYTRALGHPGAIWNDLVIGVAVIAIGSIGILLDQCDPAADERGRNAVDSKGEDIGAADDVLIDHQDSKVRFLRLGAGGFLGIGNSMYWCRSTRWQRSSRTAPTSAGIARG